MTTIPPPAPPLPTPPVAAARPLPVITVASPPVELLKLAAGARFEGTVVAEGTNIAVRIETATGTFQVQTTLPLAEGARLTLVLQNLASLLQFQVATIDEGCMAVTRAHHLFGGPVAGARSLKAAVKDELRLTCTVGMGPNILVAKLASDQAKPDGLLWIDEGMVPSVLEDLPVKKLSGIGRQTEQKLRTMGIATCGQLGRTSLALLLKTFGALGHDLRAMGAGKLDRPVETASPDPKSIGHATTLPRDIWQPAELKSCLLRLAERVGRRARKHGYKGQKVVLTIRYSDFETFSRQTTLAEPTSDTREIYRSALSTLEKIRLKKTVRLLGIALASLSKGDGQLRLFKKPDEDRRAALERAVDALNDKFGDRTVTHAAALEEEEGQKIISPAWRPSGVRKSDE
jgi:DNA polymerase-4